MIPIHLCAADDDRVVLGYKLYCNKHEDLEPDIPIEISRSSENLRYPGVPGKEMSFDYVFDPRSEGASYIDCMICGAVQTLPLTIDGRETENVACKLCSCRTTLKDVYTHDDEDVLMCRSHLQKMEDFHKQIIHGVARKPGLDTIMYQFVEPVMTTKRFVVTKIYRPLREGDPEEGRVDIDGNIYFLEDSSSEETTVVDVPIGVQPEVLMVRGPTLRGDGKYQLVEEKYSQTYVLQLKSQADMRVSDVVYRNLVKIKNEAAANTLFDYSPIFNKLKEEASYWKGEIPTQGIIIRILEKI